MKIRNYTLEDVYKNVRKIVEIVKKKTMKISVLNASILNLVNNLVFFKINALNALSTVHFVFHMKTIFLILNIKSYQNIKIDVCYSFKVMNHN